jgi:lipopolysaccharide export system permease protein
LSLDNIEFIDKEKKREVLPTLISIWWFYIKVQRTCFSIYINDNPCQCPTRKGGMGMNLTIGIAIAFGYVF